ncbi:hypothetical protein RUND412_010719 [Rhizina undulata]
MAAEFEIPAIVATLFWKWIYEHDNSDNAGPEPSPNTVMANRRLYNNRLFHMEVTRRARLANVAQAQGNHEHAFYKVVDTNPDTGNFQHANEISDFFELTRNLGEGIENDENLDIFRDDVVGPNETLTLYQRHFRVPRHQENGDIIEYSFNDVLVRRNALPPLPADEYFEINLTVQPIEFISGFNVVYGVPGYEPPQNRVRALGDANQSDNINHGFNGSFAWIVPTRTMDRFSGFTSFNILVQVAADPEKTNLAAGDGGNNRYINPINDDDIDDIIYDVALLRSQNAVADAPLGYDGISTNINAGRGGDFLYLVWKSYFTFNL